jgi:acetyl-CoA C-acetyltransferase
MGVISGMQEAVVGAGVESMSRWTRGGGVSTIDGGNPALRERFPIVPQGISADLIATLEGFTRDELDRYALQSQERAAKATAEGRFDHSIIPVANPDGSVALDRDEHPRPGTTLAGLAGLEPSFERFGQRVFDGYDRSFDQMCLDTYPGLDRIEHVHHAGNSSGLVDGASAMLVASDDFVAAHGLRPRARVLSTAAAGAEPVIMLTAPAPASRRCLDKAGMTAADIDLWEINEAFASVVLKAMRELDLDPERVNVNGGAIALGHPVGASGARLVLTLLRELKAKNLRRGLASLCIGGGQGGAVVLERMAS